MSGPKTILSIFAVPLLGLGVLLFSLCHPQITLHTDTAASQEMCLITPNPHLDKTLSIFLRQEAKDVASCRALGRPVAQAIENYNLVAKECSPAVFQATHLPAAM